MNDEVWRLQKALLESRPYNAVQLLVEWRGPDEFETRLTNCGDFVRVQCKDGGEIIPYGEGKTGPEAISSIFNALDGETMEITQPHVNPGDPEKATVVFSTKNGYQPKVA